MRLVFRLIIFLSLIFGSLCLGGAFWYVPNKIESGIIQSLNRLGFETVAIKRIVREHGKLVLTGISLDRNGFNGIERITVAYDPFRALFNGGKADAIVVDKIHLTGDFKAPRTIHIDGWTPGAALYKTLTHFPAESLRIENGDIDLLSETFGGIKIEYQGQIQRTENGDAKIRGALKSAQKKLEFRSKIDGSLTASGNLELIANATQIQLETDAIKISRAGGEINLVIFTRSPPEISVQINAGSVLWKDFSLSEVSLKIDMPDERHFRILAEGQTIGQEKMDFAASLNREDGKESYDLTVHPQKFKDFVSFLIRYNLLSPKVVFPDLLMRLNEPTVTFETQDPFEHINFTLAGRNNYFQIEGEAAYDRARKTVSGTFAMPDSVIPQDATHLFVAPGSTRHRPAGYPPEFPPEEPPQKNAEGAPDSEIPQNMLTANLYGAFEGAYENGHLRNMAWNLESEIKDGALYFGPVQLGGIKGGLSDSFPVKKAQPPSPSPTVKKTAFTLPLKNALRQDGKIIYTPGALTAPTPSVKDISLSVYGGSLKTGPLSLKGNKLPDSLKVYVSDIDLNALFRDIGFRDVRMTGKMGGILPLTQHPDGTIGIGDGILQSQERGNIRIPENITADIFPGQDKKMRTIRETLKNYNYEYFEVRLDGDMTGRLMMSINANGYNPDFMDKRPIQLSLQIETQILLLFENLLKNPE